MKESDCECLKPRMNTDFHRWLADILGHSSLTLAHLVPRERVGIAW